MKNEETTSEPQVNIQVDRLRNLAEKVVSITLQLEERLRPVLHSPEVKDGVEEADEGQVPLARELKDTSDTLETAFGTLASILARLEL